MNGLPNPAASPQGSAYLRITAAGASDRGRLRRTNEDNFLVDQHLSLYAVADGMGGHAAGEVASAVALTAFQERLEELARRWTPDTAALQMEDWVRDSLAAANGAVYRLNCERGFPPGTGMGTTLTGIWQCPDSDKVIVFHVGDSRLYQCESDACRIATDDHTLYAAWLRDGAIGPAPARHILLRAVGTHPQVEADVSRLSLHPGAHLLLCTDGLHDMLDDETIHSLAERSTREPLAERCQRLVDAANRRGGRDNVTVVIAQPFTRHQNATL